MATLARPAPLATDTDAVMSLSRAFQVLEQVEASLAQIVGVGVVSGGLVSVVSGLTVRVPSGTKFFAEGHLLTLAANQDYTISGNPTVYLWGTITRTAAAKTTPTALDTYVLTLSQNTTGTADSALHFLLAVIKTSGAAVLSLNNVPDGKVLREGSAFSGVPKSTIAAGDCAVVAANEQLMLIKLAILGTVGFNGLVRFG